MMAIAVFRLYLSKYPKYSVGHCFIHGNPFILKPTEFSQKHMKLFVVGPGLFALSITARETLIYDSVWIVFIQTTLEENDTKVVNST